MPTAAWVAISAVIAAALGGLATWAAARRQMSGSVDTSEASDLWQESKAMRDELRGEINALRTKLSDVETRLADANSRLADTNTKLSEARWQATQLRDEVIELRRLCGKTNDDVAAVHAELHVIKSETPDAAAARQEAEGQ